MTEKKTPPKKAPAKKRRTKKQIADAKSANVVANSSKLIDLSQKREDYWTNESTGVGSTTYDRHRNMVQTSQVRCDDTTLQTYYIDNDIAATVVDRLAVDALRQGYGLSFDAGDPALEAEIVSWAESQYEVAANVLQTRLWSRLFGGAALFLGANNDQALSEPLEAGVDIEFLRPYSRPDLTVRLWNDTKEDVATAAFGLPAVFETTTRTAKQYYTTNIHASRFHVSQGVLTTAARFIENDGWGDSVLTRVLDILKRFDGSWISVMHLMADSSVPIYKIKELMAMLESDQLEALTARFQLIDQQKNNMRPVMLDADGESYERVAANLGEVANVLQNAMIRLSAAAGLPVSILFGQAPAGLNATPEGDLRNLYDKVSGERKNAIAPALLHVYKMLLSQKSSPTKGQIPEGLSITFPSLWQADPVQQATLYQMMSTADGVYMANHVLTPEEVAIARSANATGGFGFPTIDIESRQEILEMTRNPADVVVAPDGEGLPDEGKPPSNARPPAEEAPAEETGAPEALNVSSDPQKAALNGAQIKALQDLAIAVADGTLPKATALSIVLASFPLDRSAAEAIFEELPADKFEEKQNAPPPTLPPAFGAPPAPAAPAEEPEADDEEPESE